MSAPPGSRNDSASLERRRGVDKRIQALAILGRRIADENNLWISQNRLNRLVRRYVADRRADIDFRVWFIAYADPTGETAVRNVMRGAR